MRLDRYLSEALGITRAQSKTLLQKGQVLVEGKVCKKGDMQVTAENEVIAGGQRLGHEEFVYLMLNKPDGVVSASTDKKDTTVVELVGDAFPRRQLFPAGRLDKTSTGFVLLTDDGAFAHDILSPRHHVRKVYEVLLDTPVTPAMIEGFQKGVTLADGSEMKPAELIPSPDEPCRCTVVLTQGVYHQIKRMFGVYDAGVNALHRQALGGLALDPALEPGQWRRITPEELALLRQE